MISMITAQWQCPSPRPGQWECGQVLAPALQYLKICQCEIANDKVQEEEKL